MDLQQVLNDRATATATYMGDTLTFKYRPAMVTVETVSKLQTEQSISELSHFFSGALVWWDLNEPDPAGSNGDRRMVEINEMIFTKLPAALVRAIAAAILHDAPKRDEGNASSGS